MRPHPRDKPDTRRGSRVVAFLMRELEEVMPPTLSSFVAFNLILFTKRLILEDYDLRYAGFTVSTVTALIVGKVVLVIDRTPFLRGFDNSPLYIRSYTKPRSKCSEASERVGNRQI